MKKIYKIRRTDTGQFWSGYSSEFSDGGYSYKTKEQACNSLKAQRALRHHSIEDWLPICEIVEFHIVEQEAATSNGIEGLIHSHFVDKLDGLYGYYFTRNYNKIIRDRPDLDLKFAFEMDMQEFSEFKTTMKGLGYSSRRFKKTDNWIWLDDVDVALNVKLVGSFKQAINLHEMKEELRIRIKTGIAPPRIPASR